VNNVAMLNITVPLTSLFAIFLLPLILKFIWIYSIRNPSGSIQSIGRES
jgi:hypothetical protein